MTSWKKAYEEGETRLGEALQRNLAANLSKDALQRENDKLREKVKRMFDWVCKAEAALDNQDHEHAVDCMARAKLSANR